MLLLYGIFLYSKQILCILLSKDSHIKHRGKNYHVAWIIGQLFNKGKVVKQCCSTRLDVFFGARWVHCTGRGKGGSAYYHPISFLQPCYFTDFPSPALIPKVSLSLTQTGIYYVMYYYWQIMGHVAMHVKKFFFLTTYTFYTMSSSKINFI